jgi:hypothetical protein
MIGGITSSSLRKTNEVMISKSMTNGIEILTEETDHLKFSIVRALGGKILASITCIYQC